MRIELNHKTLEIILETKNELMATLKSEIKSYLGDGYSICANAKIPKPIQEIIRNIKPENTESFVLIGDQNFCFVANNGFDAVIGILFNEYKVDWDAKLNGFRFYGLSLQLENDDKESVGKFFDTGTNKINVQYFPLEIGLNVDQSEIEKQFPDGFYWNVEKQQAIKGSLDIPTGYYFINKLFADNMTEYELKQEMRRAKDRYENQ
jgi:hypothetical protein